MARVNAKLIFRKSKLAQSLAKTGRRVPRLAARALAEESKRLKKVTEPFVPKKSGELRRSAIVKPPLQLPRGPIAIVTYGDSGPSKAYAEAQEGGLGSDAAPPSWSNVTSLKYTTPGTGSGFVDKGLKELNKDHEKKLADFIFKDIRAGFKG